MDSEHFSKTKLIFEVFHFEPWKLKSTLEGFWVFFHYVLFGVQIFVILKFKDIIFYYFDPLGNTSDHIKFTTTFFSYASCLIVSINYKKRYQKLKKNEKKLSEIMKSLRVDIDSVHKSYKKIHLKKFWFFLIYEVFIIAQELVLKKTEPQTIRFILAFTFPAIVNTLKFVHIIFFIDMKNKYLSVLNYQILKVKELIEMNEKRLKNPKYNKFLFGKLKILLNFYKLIVKMTKAENKCSGIFYFVNQVNLYVHILCSLYWITFRLINMPLSSLNRKYSIFSKKFAIFSIYIFQISLVRSKSV